MAISSAKQVGIPYCTLDGFPVLVLDGVQGVRVAGAHGAEEASGDGGEGLAGHGHVALADVKSLHQQAGRHLQVLQGHLQHRPAGCTPRARDSPCSRDEKSRGQTAMSKS